MRIQTDSAAQQPMAEVGQVASAQMQLPSLATDYQSLLAYSRAFPLSIDAAQQKYGLQVYDLMMQDGAVDAAVRKWKQEVLSGQLKIVPPVGFEKDTKALELCEFVERALDAAGVRLEEVFWQMLGAAVHGHEVLEPTWKDGTGKDAGKYVFESLRVIPSSLYTVVCDAYGRFLGVIGRIPGHLPVQWSGPILFPLKQLPGFVPYWKLCLFIHDQQPGDLRGRSRLQGAYNAFRLKKQTWIEWLLYLTRFSSPIPVVCLGEDATVPAEDVASSLAGLYTGGNFVGPKGSTFALVNVPNGESPYSKTLDACNREITMTILGGNRSMVESKFGSKADSETAQTGVDEDTAYVGAALSAAFTAQILRPLIEANEGADALVMCPRVVCEAEEDTFVAAGAVAASLLPLAAENQKAEIWAKVGIGAPVGEPSEGGGSRSEGGGSLESDEQARALPGVFHVKTRRRW